MAAAPGTSESDRSARNAEVARLREEGLSWAEVAARVGVSERTARRAYEEFLRTAAVVRLEDVDPERIVARVVRSHLASLDRLERLAARADNDNARLGSARAVASVGVSLLDVLARVGVLGDPGLARFHAEMRRAAEVIFRLADRHELPSEAVLEAIEALPRREAA